ncbi:MAG TPA: hypothetical protein IGS53_00200 [Leptolyngbyaceae cyanobacterium M33_DOE_097]|nr:hypothetical protein [Leptolyngbyaceae cyanobacterium M33_DOE_097]
MKTVSKLWLIFCFIAAIAPAILLGNAVFHYTVDLIFADEWGIALSYLYFLQGNLSFEWLITQQNESRLFFPKLIFVGLAILNNFQYNTFNNSILTFSTACLVSLNVFLLSRFTLPLAAWQHLLLVALANLLIFSPMQHDNWDWGIQLIVFLPIACVTTALVVTKLKLKFSVIALLTALLGTVSTFSYANGMLFWGIVYPTLLVTQVPSFKQLKHFAIRRWKPLSIWLAYAVLNIGYYFHNYKKPVGHPSFLEALKKPVDAIRYLLAFLGAPLGAGNLLTAQIMGSLLLICFVWIGIEAWRRRNREGWLQVIYPWLCIGAYTLISAIVTTAGRLGFGVIQAIDSRYTTFSAYGWVALVYLVAALLLNHDPTALPQPKRGQLLRSSAIGLLVIMLVVQSFSWSYGQRRMKLQHRYRLYGKSCLLAQELVIETDCMKAFVFPPFIAMDGFVQSISKELNHRNGWELDLMTLREVDAAISSQNAKDTLYGYLDTAFSQDINGYFKFGGWAVLPEYKYPAHGVMLVALDAKGTSTPLAIAPVDKKRRDVAKVIGTSDYRSQRFGWEMNVPKERIPSDATQVIGLAIDTHTGKLHKLAGVSQLQLFTQDLRQNKSTSEPN